MICVYHIFQYIVYTLLYVAFYGAFVAVYVVTPANFNPLKQTKFSQSLSRKPSANRTSVLKKLVKDSTEEVDESEVEKDDDDLVIRDNSHWRTESDFRLSDGLSVTKYRSNLTG